MKLREWGTPTLLQKLFQPIVRRLDDRVRDMKMMVRETSFCQLSSTSGLSIIDVLELKKVGNKSDIYVPKCQVNFSFKEYLCIEIEKISSMNIVAF